MINYRRYRRKFLVVKVVSDKSHYFVSLDNNYCKMTDSCKKLQIPHTFVKDMNLQRVLTTQSWDVLSSLYWIYALINHSSARWGNHVGVFQQSKTWLG